MARVLYGNGGSVISGRLNGITFQKGKYGYVANTTNWGANRKTGNQNEVRSAFRSVTSLWRTLTLDEQNSWALSATGDGGAYEAFVRSNIPYWLLHHELQRRNPVSPTSFTITTFSAGISYLPNNETNAYQFFLTANANYDAANVRISAQFAVGLGRNVLPLRSNATPVPFTQTISNGTIDVLQIFKADFPNQLWTIPDFIIGIWATPVDATTGAAVASEQVYYFTITPFLILHAIDFAAIAHGLNAPIDFNLSSFIGGSELYPNAILISSVQVGTLPTTPFNQNSLDSVDNIPISVANEMLTAQGQLTSGGHPVNGNSGNILYLQGYIGQTTPAVFLTKRFLVSTIMQ